MLGTSGSPQQTRHLALDAIALGGQTANNSSRVDNYVGFATASAGGEEVGAEAVDAGRAGVAEMGEAQEIFDGA